MTKIEWVRNSDGTKGKTWNPMTGCTKISAGCKNCYAENIAKRFWGDRKFSDIQFHPERLRQPLSWKDTCKVFVCSMSDLFHEEINNRGDEVRSIFRIMASCEHIFVLLTKRPRRMKESIDYFYGEDFAEQMPNIWLGVTAENQEMADKRIPVLLQIPATVRFISVEPMLGYVDLSAWLYNSLEWVICGCESGPKRRPAKRDWIEDLREQCIDSDTPFFLKQMEINNKLVKMPELNGRVWSEMP